MVDHRRQVNKFTNLIAKEYGKKNPDRDKIAKYARLGTKHLRLLKKGKHK